MIIFTVVGCSGGEKADSPQTDTPNRKEGKESDDKSDEPEGEEDPILSDENELKILTYYTGFNMEEQPSYEVVEEMTGYKVKWFNLPQENADEKLLLEIAGGTSYDLLMRMSTNQTNQLYVQNALVDLKPYLDKYGENIYEGISDMSLEALTDEDGMIYAYPTNRLMNHNLVIILTVSKRRNWFQFSYLEELVKIYPKFR